MLASRLGYAAAHAIDAGLTQMMAGWRPDEPNGLPFDADPRVQFHKIDDVLLNTERLLDGSHPTTMARVHLLAKAQGILTL